MLDYEAPVRDFNFRQTFEVFHFQKKSSSTLYDRLSAASALQDLKGALTGCNNNNNNKPFERDFIRFDYTGSIVFHAPY